MTDKLNEQKMAANYGFALAFLNSDPELKALFKKAVKKTWDTNMFVARLRATKWFRNHSASVRNAIMQETSDPATYKANVDQMASRVRDAFGKAYGSTAGAILGQDQLGAWAETAYRMGWSEEQLMDHMGATINFQKLLRQNKLGGTASEMAHNIDQVAEQMGVAVGDNWKAAQVKRVLMGDDTDAAVQARIRDIAAAKYGAFADDIRAGRTVTEIADPYVQQMSQLLELDPAQVNITKSREIQRALTTKNSQGVPTGMDMNDFADMIRRDKRWQYTDNAKQQAADVTSQLLRGFGFM